MLAIALLAAPAAQAAFPGQNGKIAFDSPFTGGSFGFEREVSTINPDGTARAPLLPTPVHDRLPAWSPNGQRVVFTRADFTSQDNEIWVANADGTGATQLTDGSEDTEPAFSGDGARIVFGRNDGQPQFDNEIWVMNADGTNPVKLTNNATWDANPVFSPDSSRIAFDREVTGTGIAVFTMAADGTGEAPLTPTDGSMIAQEPDFSPDGTRLAFSRCEDVVEGCDVAREIATVPSAGGAITEITSNAGNFDDPRDVRPAFSPDGTRIAFARDDIFGSGVVDILTVGASGGATTPVTTTGEDENPDWQPLAGGGGGGGAAGQSEKPGRCQGATVTIHGSRGDDVINGTPGRDVIHGLRGRDVIHGLGGNDRICGGRGKDRLFGDAGNDVLFGGAGSDFLHGGAGDDKLFGGTPNAPPRPDIDTCHGGSGNDRLRNCQRP